MGIHPVRNCENIAHVNRQNSPIHQLLNSPMDNNEQQVTYVNDLHLNIYTYFNGRWVHCAMDEQNNLIMVRMVNFYMVQMDDGSTETMDTWQHSFIEADKE
jgi:hypothetical protein